MVESKPCMEVTIAMSINGLDITRNVRIIENLKSKLLECISHLYSQMASDQCEDLRGDALDTLSDIIIVSYLLSRRLGLDYAAIEKEISSKIRLGLLTEHETEKYFGDISALSQLRRVQTS